MVPIIVHCLHHPEPGVRYAAGQCVRTLSRSVSALRTAIGDSMLPDVLLSIIKKDPNNRVVGIALMGIANLVRFFGVYSQACLHSNR